MVWCQYVMRMVSVCYFLSVWKLRYYFPMQNWEKMVLRISVEGIVPVIVERWEMVSRRCSAMRKLSSPLLSPFIRGRIDSMA